MYFLIGVIILIVFVIGIYIYIKCRIRNVLDGAGFSGMNLKDIIDEARLEDQEVPKSLASMDRIYLNQIEKDFPDIHISELKRKAETILMNCFQAIEKKDSSSLKGKIKSFVEEKILEYQGKNVSFGNFKIHNTVISNYKKDKAVATIYFSISFEYYLNANGKEVKTQDRVKLEFIYVIDESELPEDITVLGIHCPNCGSPITNLGYKSCSYCGSQVQEVIGRVFTCNDIVSY